MEEGKEESGRKGEKREEENERKGNEKKRKGCPSGTPFSLLYPMIGSKIGSTSSVSIHTQ